MSDVLSALSRIPGSRWLDFQLRADGGEWVLTGVLAFDSSTGIQGVESQLREMTQALGLRWKVTVLEVMNQPGAASGTTRWSLLVIGRQISLGQMAEVVRFVEARSFRIQSIRELSQRRLKFETHEDAFRCFELLINGAVGNADEFRGELLEISDRHQMDLIWQADDAFRRARRLVCFDMDSTLIQCEVIDELAARAGVGAEVASITEAAMRGEVDFRESLTGRVALLRGLRREVLEDIAARLPITPGAGRLCRTLKCLGCRTAILSGGFDFFGRVLQRRLGIDEVFCNQLEIMEGRLTGGLVGPIVDASEKARMLREIASREGIDRRQTMAVGDGANDLEMLRAAGLGIAFHAKPLVRRSAPCNVQHAGLDALLYVVGLLDEQVDELLAV